MMTDLEKLKSIMVRTGLTVEQISKSGRLDKELDEMRVSMPAHRWIDLLKLASSQ
jgi:hypothetical protein